jgi:hypothetical protein
MADLTDFGATAEPRLEKRREVTLGYRSVGYYGRDVRSDTKCYITEREAEDHRYHGEDPWYDLPFDGDGHALSVELFERISDYGAGRVYVIETDTGTVFHYGFRQFVNGSPINFEDEADDRGYEKDPQMVVAIEDAATVYEDAYPGVYAKQAAFS